MEKIRIKDLQPGQVFSRTLFSFSGQKLLHASIPLTERHIAAMRQYGDLEVLVAESVADLVEAGIVDRVDSSELAVGKKSAAGVISRTGQIVVEPGEEVEAHHLDALQAGGGAFSAKAAAQQRRERILLGDELVNDLEQMIPMLDIRVSPESSSTWIKPADPAGWPVPEILIAQRAEQVETIRRLYARIEAGLDIELSKFNAIVDDLLHKLAQHPTRFTQLALLCPRREDYLPDHAYTVTVLAMAIAAQLRWPIAAVRGVGQAGMLYDLGMLLVPERIRTGGCQLTDIDRSRVQRHPIFSLAMMEVVADAEPILKLAAMQHHERENGSGYPRGTRRDGTCDYARVLAVADTFAASTEPRHYRKPKLPYIAMEETLRSTSVNVFWKPAVRALLQAAGLFPVGSYVKLSTGKNAHVIAANAKQLDRPTVQPLDAAGEPIGEPVDLATVPTTEVSVVRPIMGATG